MKREIKFKAKHATTGEWVYGYIADKDVIYDGDKSHNVDMNTICEFTGMKTPVEKYGFDDNGYFKICSDIYEHDILEYSKENTINLNGGYCCPVPTKHGDKFIVRWTESGFILIPLSQFSEEKIKDFNENGITPNTGYIISSYDTWDYHHYFSVIGNEFD